MKKLHFNTNRNLVIGAVGLLIAILIFAFAPVGSEKQEVPTAMALLPVEIALPVNEKITEWDEYTGRFEASSRTEVRARVSGFLEKVNFEDGQHVDKGQTLFLID